MNKDRYFDGFSFLWMLIGLKGGKGSSNWFRDWVGGERGRKMRKYLYIYSKDYYF